MEEKIINRSLELNRAFVKNQTKQELNDFMKEFDDYEIEK